MTAESVWVRVRAGLADELIRQGNVPDAVEDALTIMDEGGTFGEAMRALEAWGRQPVGHDLPGRVAPSGRSAPARAGEEPSEAASGHLGQTPMRDDHTNCWCGYEGPESGHPVHPTVPSPEARALAALRFGNAEPVYCHCYPVFRCEPATAEVEGPEMWRPVCERCMQIAFDAGIRVRKLVRRV